MLKPEHNTFQPFTDGFHETGSQVHDWVLKRAREHFAGDEKRKQQVTDRKRFEAYRAERRMNTEKTEAIYKSTARQNPV